MPRALSAFEVDEATRLEAPQIQRGNRPAKDLNELKNFCACHGLFESLRFLGRGVLWVDGTATFQRALPNFILEVSPKKTKQFQGIPKRQQKGENAKGSSKDRSKSFKPDNK